MNDGKRKSGARRRNDGVTRRLAEACAGMPFAEVARVTATNPECVRRYLTGVTPPSVEFVANICVAFDLSSEWVLWGRGPASRTEVPNQLLRNAGMPALLRALADELELFLKTPSDGPPEPLPRVEPKPQRAACAV